MRTQHPKVMVFRDYHVTLTVKYGQLVISARMTGPVTRTVLSRNDARRITTVVFSSASGSFSLQALDWCEESGIAVVLVRNGRTTVLTPGEKDSRLLRRQVLLPDAGQLAVTRELIARKLDGQAENLRSCGIDTGEFTAQAGRVRTARTVKALSDAEGNAARVYWNALAGIIRVPVDTQALKAWPAHWHRFAGRPGLYPDSSRGNAHAADVVNAMINYGTAVAEAAVLLECRTAGLHPSAGYAHTDESGKGLVLDLLEPCRPVIDAVVLSALECGRGLPFTDDGKPWRFTAGDALEMPSGEVRLGSRVTQWLAPAVLAAVSPVAASAAGYLAAVLTGKVPPALAPVPEEEATAGALDSSCTVTDLVPGELWARILPLLPPLVTSSTRDADRRHLAIVIAREIYGVSWNRAIEVLGSNYGMVRGKLRRWETAGAWPLIRQEITSSDREMVPAVPAGSTGA